MEAIAPGHIVWLGDPVCQQRALVGGKAAMLARLAGSYRVPVAFCLTTEAHRCATSAGHAGDEAAELPGTLRGAVAAAYRILGERCGVAQPPVAVRSSAVEEDSTTASFAGQYDTYLNVVGDAALEAAILHCWASARADRVAAYRRQRGLAGDDVRLAVLVQQLVVADVSAVAFSANPVTGAEDEIVINASWGLGESLVGGAVTPDTYTVRKHDLTVLTRQIAEKRCMTVPITGGTREVDVPQFLRTQPTLDEAQIRELAHLALALEAAMGWHVDVECAYRGAALYLLQCRPITTLSRPAVHSPNRRRRGPGPRPRRTE